jgi:putative peptide maturation system protein
MFANHESSTARVLLRAASFLENLHDAATPPPDARRRLRELQAENPDVELELVADEETFRGSFHYDLLMRFSEQESMSLSYCHDHGLPWAMRGARRWTERDLLRVNDVVLHVDEVLGCLEFDSNDASSMQALVNIAILREALEHELVPVSPEELQQAMNAFRRKRRLHRAADTHAWLRERGLSHEQLEGIVFQQALAAAFRRRVVAADIEPYFQDHRFEFDTAAVAMILYGEEAAARQDLERIRRGEINFYAAAENAVLRETETTATLASIARLQRGSLPPELAKDVFSAAINEVIGPVRYADGWAVARLLGITPATLDQSTRQTIEERLFEHWLDQRRAKARIEWYWGNIRQTGAPSPAGTAEFR